MATIKRWLQSHSGKILDAENPTPEMIDIQDIAHALSMVCRYGGHCRDFYSVAEHSVHVMRLGQMHPTMMSITAHWAKRSLALLLHDAAEAYMGDIMTPNKILLAPKSHELENKWLTAIEKKFGLEGQLIDPEPLVKDCDLTVLTVEVVSLFVKVDPVWWEHFHRPTRIQLESTTIECWSPAVARKKFLDCFNLIEPLLPASK